MKNQIHIQINENSELEATKINRWNGLKHYILWNRCYRCNEF